jgi:hypothetical protein
MSITSDVYIVFDRSKGTVFIPEQTGDQKDLHRVMGESHSPEMVIRMNTDGTWTHISKWVAATIVESTDEPIRHYGTLCFIDEHLGVEVGNKVRPR